MVSTLSEASGTNDFKENELEPVDSGDPSLGIEPNESHGKIYCARCGFPLVRNTARKFGMKITTDEFDTWTVYWGDRFPTPERYRFMKRYQRINHLPGILEICRKDSLAQNLNRMLKCFPKEYDFFPKTWCLPKELNGLLDYAKSNPQRTFIFKPSRGSLGRGIYLTKNIEHLDLLKKMIGQVYLNKPFLIDGFKFDLRVYVLVSSVKPLRVYVYNEGLARFATEKYEPSNKNLHVKYMHLTNYSVNKFNSSFNVDQYEGSKRKLSTIHEWLLAHSHDPNKIWATIDDVVIKTILVALPQMRQGYANYFKSHVDSLAGFELLGFDFILDSKLKPYVLEVNHTPSFTRCTQLDREVKDNLLYDTFQLLNLPLDEYSRVMEEEKILLKERIASNTQVLAEEKSVHERILKERGIWETAHLGNYRKIYPPEDDKKGKYRPFLKAMLISSPEELGADTKKQLRKNPFKFTAPTLSVSDKKSCRKILLESYSRLSRIHGVLNKSAERLMVDELILSRTNQWDSAKPNYYNLYEEHKKKFTEEVVKTLKDISKKSEIVNEDKTKISSIFLDPPLAPGLTLKQSHLGPIVGPEPQPSTAVAINPQIPNKNPPKRSYFSTTDIFTEDMDFIPGYVVPNEDKSPKPIYKFNGTVICSSSS